MATDQTTSILWLWVLQVAWWLAAMLPLAAAVIFIALGFRWLHRRARDIEAKPVEAGPGGFGKLLRDKLSHMAIGRSMLYLIIGGLALGGMLALFIQSFVQPEVQEAVEQGDLMKPAAVAPPGREDPMNFIFFLALVLGALTLVMGIRTYRSLRVRAAEKAAQLPGQSPRPLLVRWFHDSKKMGLATLVIGGWVCFGLLMQVVGLIVLFVPLPKSLANLPLSWAPTAVIGVLLAGSILLFLAFLGFPVWMGLRHLKLEVRYYQENQTFRTMVNVWAVFGMGAFGALLSMHLLTHLGNIFWPSIFH